MSNIDFSDAASKSITRDDVERVVNGEKPSARILNYVWIAPDYDDPKRDFMCTIPLHYLDLAYENAKRWPDTPVVIWIDSEFLDNSSRFAVMSHYAKFAPQNVIIRDLRKVEAYTGNPIFTTDWYVDQSKNLDNFYDHNIWQRVDAARLIVIEHCIDNMAVDDVIYSDFDIPDLDLENEDLEQRLVSHGFVVGSIKNQKEEMLENSLFVFRKGEGERLFKTKLLPRTLSEIDPAERECCHTSLLRFCGEYIRERGLPKNTELGYPVHLGSGIEPEITPDQKDFYWSRSLGGEQYRLNNPR